jgi:hypothetical protein
MRYVPPAFPVSGPSGKRARLAQRQGAARRSGKARPAVAPPRLPERSLPCECWSFRQTQLCSVNNKLQNCTKSSALINLLFLYCCWWAGIHGLLQQPLASLSFTTSTKSLSNGAQCQQLSLAVLLASWSSGYHRLFWGEPFPTTRPKQHRLFCAAAPLGAQPAREPIETPCTWVFLTGAVLRKVEGANRLVVSLLRSAFRFLSMGMRTKKQPMRHHAWLVSAEVFS